MDKDTHTWRWWPRRVVTRLLQPADTGQEEAEEMGEKVEVQEEEEEMRKDILCPKKGGGSKLCSDDSGCVGRISDFCLLRQLTTNKRRLGLIAHLMLNCKSKYILQKCLK